MDIFSLAAILTIVSSSMDIVERFLTFCQKHIYINIEIKFKK